MLQLLRVTKARDPAIHVSNDGPSDDHVHPAVACAATTTRLQQARRHDIWQQHQTNLEFAVPVSSSRNQSVVVRAPCAMTPHAARQRQQNLSASLPRCDAWLCRVNPTISTDSKHPNTGALTIRRIRFGVYYTIIIIRNPQNSIGNYLGPDIKSYHRTPRQPDSQAAGELELQSSRGRRSQRGSGLWEVAGFRVQWFRVLWVFG